MHSSSIVHTFRGKQRDSVYVFVSYVKGKVFVFFAVKFKIAIIVIIIIIMIFYRHMRRMKPPRFTAIFRL